MSSAQGFPDWQRITQWLGSPIITETGRVIGAATITDGPYQVSNFASVIVALKPTGGAVTVTIKQTVPAGPASLVLTESVVVPDGATLFEAFVLFGGAVELDITGTVAGVAVDYALYGSNTTTNAQVITSATINVQQNDVLVAAEPTLDFEDVLGFVWGIADDAVNTRVKITPPIPGLALIADLLVGAGGAGSFSFAAIPQGYKHLVVVGELGSDGGADLDLYLRVNGIGTASYLWNGIKVIGAAPSYPSSPGVAQATVGFVQANAGQVSMAPFFMVIPNYQQAALKPQWLSLAGGNGFNQLVAFYAGMNQNAGAVASLFFLPSGGSFRAGSRLTLYGMG